MINKLLLSIIKWFKECVSTAVKFDNIKRRKAMSVKYPTFRTLNKPKETYTSTPNWNEDPMLKDTDRTMKLSWGWSWDGRNVVFDEYKRINKNKKRLDAGNKYF